MREHRRALASAEIAALIDRLASQTRLGLFVGAGVSVEAGLPSWNSLLDRLLKDIAPTTEAFRRARSASSDDAGRLRLDDSISSFAEITKRSVGPLGAAAVVKQHQGGNYGSAIRHALYTGREPVAPGPTALAFARLILDTKKRNRAPILTTNFDVLLELALIEELERRGKQRNLVETVLPGEPLDEGKINVVHLHGVVPHPGYGDRPPSEIVFAEDEFFEESELGKAAEKLAREHLTSTPYLFLGASLTDPNILGYLYRCAGKGAAHTAVTVSQQAATDVSRDARQVVIDSLQETGAARLRKAGVDVGFVDTYSEASQVIRELSLQRAAVGKNGGMPYRRADWCWEQRAHRFEQRALAAGLLPAEGDVERFVDLQPHLQRVLDSARKAIQEGFAQIAAFKDENEHLAFHLWAHAPEAQRIVMVGQSDRQIFNPATLQVADSVLPTDKLVVEALCNGTVVEAGEPGLESSRWGSMLAVPFAVEESREAVESVGASIQAGVVVLASTNTGGADLSRLRVVPEERNLMIAALRRLGAEIAAGLVEAVPDPGELKPPLKCLEVPVELSRPAEEGESRRIGSATEVGGAPLETSALGRWKMVAPANLGNRLREA